ncbi:hypothetical protein Q5691_23290 [Microcoleus sp. w1-18aA5]|uniref:hypothetical protein n=1 Tax=unclassified Microcoleus TaxID=2642155 RepID=UPI002FD53D50
MTFTFGLEFDRYIQATTQLRFSGLTLPITRRKLPQTATDRISTVGCIGVVRVRASLAVF